MIVKNCAVALTLATPNKTEDEQQIETVITYTYNIYSLQFLVRTNLWLVSSADMPSTSPTDTLPNKEIVIALIHCLFMLNVSLHRCLLHEVRFQQKTGVPSLRDCLC